MKKILISLFLLIGLVGVVFAQPYTIMVGFVNSEGATVPQADITWSAVRTAEFPTEILSDEHLGGTNYNEDLNGYGFSALNIQCAGWDTPWAAGHVVDIRVEQISTGDYLEITETITGAAEGFQYWTGVPNPITMIAGVTPVPDPTTLVAPADATADAAIDVELSWNVAPGATGYKVYFGTENPPVEEIANQVETTFNPALDYEKTYYWQVVPFNGEGDAVECPVWSFTTVPYHNPGDGVDFEGDIPEGTPAPTVDMGDGSGYPLDPEDVFNEQYNITINAAIELTIVLNNTVPTDGVVAHIGSGIIPGAVFDYVAGKVTFTWTFTAGRSTEQFVIYQDNDPNTNVEFARPLNLAIGMDKGSVDISWETATETDVLLFNVLRSDNSDIDSAVKIGSQNAMGPHSYRVNDNKELDTNMVYTYWLQTVAIDGNISYHGPVSIELKEEEFVPVVRTILGNAYPNPFTNSTNLELAVKDGEVANVTVYNILGQAVRSFTAHESTRINWDRTNDNGKVCGSGIYFFRLSSPSNTQTKKVVVVK